METALTLSQANLGRTPLTTTRPPPPPAMPFPCSATLSSLRVLLCETGTITHPGREGAERF